MLLGEAFLIFRELGVLTRRVLGLIYTPSRYPCRTLPGEARRPMGSRFPGLTLAFNGLRQWSRKCFRCKSVVILHKYFYFIICSKWVHPKRTLNITIYCVSIQETTTYCYNSGFSISGSSGALFFSSDSLSNLFSQKQPAKLLLDLFQTLAWFILLVFCTPPVRGVPPKLSVELHCCARVISVSNADIRKRMLIHFV